MTERDDILRAIGRALHRGAPSPARGAAVAERLARPPANPLPSRARPPHDRQVALFEEMAAAVAATIVHVSEGAVVAAAAAYLAENGLPQTAVVAPALQTAGDWHPLTVRFGTAGPDDAVGLAPAFAGVAETGTLVLLSGPRTPTRLNFLPDTHIVILAAADIVGTYEDAWRRIRALPDGLPRTVNLITGPSRTGDIEQTIQLGAHGPRRLHIVIVDG